MANLKPSLFDSRQNKIVGGTETGINEFPMMAGLVDLESARIICGATIISPRRAITAAHCLVRRTTGSAVLLVGDHDLRYAFLMVLCCIALIRTCDLNSALSCHAIRCSINSCI